MQTLGLSESTPRSESRLRALFWPSIQSAADVDYLGTQGYWICTIVAVLSFIFLLIASQPFAALITFPLIYFGGVGVRERSWLAAAIVFVYFLTDTLLTLGALLSGAGIVRIVILALLFANLRATWIASQWAPQSQEAELPPRLSATWGDKFSDQLPAKIWPKVRIVYYIFSLLLLCLTEIGAVMILLRRLK
jgi:hypothetical protein